MTYYDPNIRPDNMPGIEGDAAEQVEHRYINSARFITDALDWVGGHGHEHAKLMDVIIDYYCESPAFRCVIEDVMDGEVDL